MNDPWAALARARTERQDAGLVRTLAPLPAGVLDLASNDYLGLSRHPEVVAAATRALQVHGAGATGSRLVTGTTSLHLELEAALARLTTAPAALVFSSGYLANLGVVGALAGPGTLIVSDADNHASLIDACRLSRAEVVVVPHAEPGAVATVLARSDRPALVVTDAVFSVDGEVAPLAELLQVVRRAQGVLLVDEAHGLGVLGPGGAGACAAAGIAEAPELVRTVTLSKALGSQGGAVLGPVVLRDTLVDTARPFIFDTGLAPSSCAAALTALGLADDARRERLRQAGAALAVAVGVDPTAGAVVRVPVGDPHRALAAQARLLADGVAVGCFRPPSVPAGASCLRLTARADLRAEDVERAGSAVRRVLSDLLVAGG